MGQDKEIIILENTKPILGEKAFFYKDGLFIDRLKKISKSLAHLGKKLPTKQQLDNAAFIDNELSSFVPTQNLDLVQGKDGKPCS